jgi:hypothetical protein
MCPVNKGKEQKDILKMGRSTEMIKEVIKVKTHYILKYIFLEIQDTLSLSTIQNLFSCDKMF